MKTYLKVAFMFVCFFSVAKAIELSWTNYSQGLRGPDNVTPLNGSKTDPTIGYFIQLIYAGPNGVPDPISLASTSAVGGDDVVVDYSYIGFGSAFLPSDGNISDNSSLTLVAGDSVFVRIWNAISPNFASGLAPTPINGGLATHYGNSDTYTLTSVPIQTFVIPNTSTLILVPEPVSVALVGVSLSAVIFGLRRRRYRI